MTRLFCILLTLLFSLSGPAMGEYSDFGQSSNAAFKVVVGDARYTSTGLPRGTIMDSVEGGFLEIKAGSSVLDSTYQLRLQTYRSLVENSPLTIQTMRPVGSEFRQWLDRWGVSIQVPPGAP